MIWTHHFLYHSAKWKDYNNFHIFKIFCPSTFNITLFRWWFYFSFAMLISLLFRNDSCDFCLWTWFTCLSWELCNYTSTTSSNGLKSALKEFIIAIISLFDFGRLITKFYILLFLIFHHKKIKNLKAPKDENEIQLKQLLIDVSSPCPKLLYWSLLRIYFTFGSEELWIHSYSCYFLNSKNEIFEYREAKCTALYRIIK